MEVCVVGAGPAGCYAAAALLRGGAARVAVLDRRPFPFGLVRAGVAPDHPDIRAVERKFAANVFRDPRVRFFGGVVLGPAAPKGPYTSVCLSELRARFSAGVVLACGADRERPVFSEPRPVAGVYGSLDAVGWYTADPWAAAAGKRRPGADLAADPPAEVAVVGHGNVALDVARMLLLPPAALAQTDVARSAETDLARWNVRRVRLIGRRGPAQCAFANRELRELLALPSLRLRVEPLGALDALAPECEAGVSENRLRRRMLDQMRERLSLQGVVGELAAGERELVVQFYRAPLTCVPGPDGRVRALECAVTALSGPSQRRLATPTGARERVPADMVVSCAGYTAGPLADVPHDAARGVVPCDAGGRVLDGVGGSPLPGLYAAGWLARGADGLIGGQRADADAAAATLLEDAGRASSAEGGGGVDSLLELLRSRPAHAHFSSLLARLGPAAEECARTGVDFDAWEVLEAAEDRRGQAVGKPRWKYESFEEYLQAIH
jgi:NADPH-dependent glutamate synthase beta subunit-like oxidoreductase